MNKFTLYAVLAMAAAPLFATPNWALVTTEGANGDTSGDFNGYKAYFCTKAAAAEMFEGNDTITAITQYFATDIETYNKGMEALSASGTELSPYAYDDDQYSFTKYLQTALVGEYLAVLLANAGESTADVRVFDAMADVMGNLTFDPSAGEGSAGNWTTIPEPTTAILLLLGVAGLTLRRKFSFSFPGPVP